MVTWRLATGEANRHAASSAAAATAADASCTAAASPSEAPAWYATAPGAKLCGVVSVPPRPRSRSM